MDTKFPEVPVFSPAFLALADVCARELWAGRGYDDGKIQLGRAVPIQGTQGKFKANLMSDEVLLYLCSGRFMYQALSNRFPAPFRINEAFVQSDFMKVARLNALNTHLSNLDITSGLDYLYTATVLDYRYWKSTTSQDMFSIYVVQSFIYHTLSYMYHTLYLNCTL